VKLPAVALSVAVLLGMVVNQKCAGQINYNNAGYGIEPMEYSRVGTAGWQFLKLPSGARSTAMGGTRAAVGYGDALAAFTNPASTADVKGIDVQFSSMNWVADIQYNGLSVVNNMGDWGCLGANLVYVDYGDMVRTEIGEFNGQPGVVAITEGLGTFTAYDYAVGVLYSRQVTSQLQLGGTVRYLQQKIDDAVMSTWSVDIGTLYRTGLGSLRISMLGRNFGPDGEFPSFEERIAQAPAQVRLPMIFVLGAAYDLMEMSDVNPQRLTVALDYVKPNDGPDKANLGVEYFLFHHFYLRGGYRFNYDEETFTLGLGLEYSVDDDVQLKFDYAYADLGRFNSTNMLSVGVGF